MSHATTALKNLASLGFNATYSCKFWRCFVCLFYCLFVCLFFLFVCLFVCFLFFVFSKLRISHFLYLANLTLHTLKSFRCNFLSNSNENIHTDTFLPFSFSFQLFTLDSNTQREFWMFSLSLPLSHSSCTQIYIYIYIYIYMGGVMREIEKKEDWLHYVRTAWKHLRKTCLEIDLKYTRAISHRLFCFSYEFSNRVNEFGKGMNSSVILLAMGQF